MKTIKFHIPQSNFVNGLNQGEGSKDRPKVETIWSPPVAHFIPRKELGLDLKPQVGSQFNSDDTICQIFQKLFPPSLFIYIAECTNKKIAIFNSSASGDKGVKFTNAHEIKIMLGCMLVMTYVHFPLLKDYWSTGESLGSDIIKSGISRDRFAFLQTYVFSAFPDKPSDSRETNNTDEIMNSLRSHFQEARTESSFQTINEWVSKFRGKPIRRSQSVKTEFRGINTWMRCDIRTGYTYDFNIYPSEEVDDTFSERIVSNLSSSIQDRDVTLCFDHRFTSIDLFEKIDFSAFGSFLPNKRRLPPSIESFKRGPSKFLMSNTGLTVAKWNDNKDYLVVSNCHGSDMSTIVKQQEDGTSVMVSCPSLIKQFLELTYGIDQPNQMSNLHELNIRSNAWWKQTLYRLLLISVVNSRIIHLELSNSNLSLTEFISCLAEGLIQEGRNILIGPPIMKKNPVRRPTEINLKLSHLPIVIVSRKRCVGCQAMKRERRTQILCEVCDISLCINCFAPYHKKTMRIIQ